MKTGEDVAIKFAEEYRHFSLEKEYVNYLYLGGDGRYSNFSILFFWQFIKIKFSLEPDIVERGIPHIIHYGDFCEYKVLVMTKAGTDLYELVEEAVHRYFSFTTICKIAIQAVCNY